MHEMALAEGILGVALDVGEGRPVKRIQLRIGALQHVTPDSLRFCFQLVAENTPAASAVLDLEPLPARLRCRRCRAESLVEAAPFQCRSCGAFDVDVAGGDELLVDAIELDDGWRRRPAEPAPVEVPPEHLAEHALAEDHPGNVPEPR